jgi:extracellular factor (EF) 3-hydroxypalmitic acid methyl ester biosynthesis protein
MSDLLPAVRDAAQRLKSALRDIEERLPRALGERAYAEVKAALDRCLHELSQLGCWGPANQYPSSELWNIAGDCLARGWLPNRARTKPRGYAGDFEMLARMYESICCEDPLGRHFDRYFQEETAPRCVRNRMHLMREWIVEAARTHRRPGGVSLPVTLHPKAGKAADLVAPPNPSTNPQDDLHVAIVGSAFGLEVRDALRELAPAERARVRVTLLDIDPAAVEFGRSQLEPWLAPDKITAEAANLFRLPERATIARHIAAVDLLFCPGLFDYLDDAAAAKMLGAFWQQLVPGGRMVVFQFAPHNSSRAFMEWVGNWYLIYRDASEWRQVVQSSSISPTACQFGAEELGVDLFVSAVKS